MFNIGDQIVYPLHGAGVIESIEEKDISGKKESYYILKLPGEVKAMFPIDKAQEIGIRDLVSKEDATKVIKALGENQTEMSLNWNRRYRDNMDKMKNGDLYDIADIVRNLSFKQKDKGLSTGEKKMLLNAKQILVSELVLVEQTDTDAIEELIDSKINGSYIKNSAAKLPDVAEDSVVTKFIPFD